MFDVIGKRRWFFLFSALLTIPGLIFILLTPITERRGRAPVLDRLHGRHLVGDQVPGSDRRRRPDQGRPGAGQGISDATVIATSDGFFEIRSRQVAPAASGGAQPEPVGRRLGLGSRQPRPARPRRERIVRAPARQRIGRRPAQPGARRPRRRVGRRQPGYVAGSLGQPREPAVSTCRRPASSERSQSASRMSSGRSSPSVRCRRSDR